jgi:hypothetical protein
MNCTVLLTRQFWDEQIKKMRWTGNMASMGDRRGAFRVSMGTPEGKSELGRLWRRWDEVSQ